MRRLWPQLGGQRKETGLVVWQGALKPHAQVYQVMILWWPGTLDRPYTVILSPAIKPLEGGTYEQVPHLMFDPDRPEKSGLCLFDPEGSEWSPADLIAETTVMWTCEWLHYYELWHLTSEWLSPSIGHESVAAMRAAEAHSIRKALDNVY